MIIDKADDFSLMQYFSFIIGFIYLIHSIILAIIYLGFDIWKVKICNKTLSVYLKFKKELLRSI